MGRGADAADERYRNKRLTRLWYVKDQRKTKSIVVLRNPSELVLERKSNFQVCIWKLLNVCKFKSFFYLLFQPLSNNTGTSRYVIPHPPNHDGYDRTYVVWLTTADSDLLAVARRHHAVIIARHRKLVYNGVWKTLKREKVNTRRSATLEWR